MHKIFSKNLFLFLLLCWSVSTRLSAQTVTIGSVGNNYGQGSTISVPFTIDNSGGCIAQNNRFDLYLSDATGSFAAETQIGSFTGFYTTFINGVIPTTATTSPNYRVRIKNTTNPSTPSSPSAPFTINNVPGVVAAASSIFINPAYPEVFGSCMANDNSPYYFNSDDSTPGSDVTAHFNNEITNTSAGDIVFGGGGSPSFNARLANYTVTVTAIKNGIVGTKSYMLINNRNANRFGISGSATACLNGNNTLTFSVDISNTGIRNNFPGLLYRLKWGDGTSDTYYTLCELIALGGNITHTFTSTSCGNVTANQRQNVFSPSIQPVSIYCNEQDMPAAVTTDVTILEPAINLFSLPATACLGEIPPIVNNSYPGMSPSSTANGCTNGTALYTWLVDNFPKQQNVPLNGSFNPNAFITTPGNHIITLQQQTGSYCTAADLTLSICVQAKPVPVFSLSPNTICPEDVVAPGNISTIDNSCNNSNIYNWTITGPDNVVNNTANVEFINATDAHSQFPQFRFHTPGIYQVQLGIITASCGTVLAPAQTITVNAGPTATLSLDVILCGKNQTLNFDNNNGNTHTILSGTINENSTTYTWTVTGPDNSVNNPANAEFMNGTNNHSKYPQIKFKDNGTYSVKVDHVNNCGSATDTQVITFQLAPEVDAGPDQTICEGNQVSLNGTITDPANSVTSYSWVGGSNSFTNGNTLNATYTPTTADINAGQVTLTLRANTSSTQCNIINNDVVITITRKDHITSANANTICSGQNANYTITATNPATTFAWTAAVTAGTATGITPSGTGITINDAVTNTGNINTIVAYTIIPTTNGCPGIPFVFNLTVKPLPVITAPVAVPTICSNQPAGITMSSNVSGTTYIWTSTAAAGISGNTNRTTATSTASIQDVLINNSTTAGNVTYTITPYNGTCPGSPVTATVTVQPLPTVAYAGPDQVVCNNSIYTLQGNTPVSGTGRWTIVSSQTGVTFADDTNPTTTVSGLVQGNIYQFRWTITASSSCPASSSTVTITNTIETVGGSVSAPATVCSGSNAGTLTLSGHTGQILRWERSIDNGTNWAPIVNTTTSYSYLNLTQTTQYRAVVQNNICSIKMSSPVTITVNPVTLTANAGSDMVLCGVASVTLTGNNPSPFNGAWTQTGGPAVTIVSPTSAQTQVVGLTGGTTYKFTWTISGLPPCPNSSDELTVVNANETVGGSVSASATVCSGSNNGTLTLSGQVGQILRWEKSTDNGVNWVPIVNTTASYNYLNLTQTTQYRAVVQNNICSVKMSAPVTITVNPVTIVANAGSDMVTCGAVSITLNGNNPSPFVGTWTQTAGPAVTIVSPASAQTQVIGLTGGSIYKFTWTITGIPPCADTNDELTVVNAFETVAGTVTAPAIVCSGSNNGILTLTGQVGQILRWEKSTDNGSSWLPVVNTTPTLNYLNLTQTTQYRTVVQNNICSIKMSAPVTITVNPVTIVANAGIDINACSINSITLSGNNPSPFIGVWTQTAGPAVTIVNPANAQTQVTGLTGGNIYKFTWTIKGLPPCADSNDEVIITDNTDVVASFTADKNSSCGTALVKFTNTSSTLAGTNFVWDFGDGSPQSTDVSPQHSFKPRADGKQAVYTVSLNIIGNCVARPPVTYTVTVNPAVPIATILPNDLSGCGAFTLSVQNVSPGTNAKYVFYLYDGSTLVQSITKTDKSAVTFNALTTTVTKIFTLYMVTTDLCGTTAKSAEVPITITPVGFMAQMFVKDGVKKGCAPLSVSFVNNSSGGDIFSYNIYNENNILVENVAASKSDLPYVFTKPGTYFITIKASDNCATLESTSKVRVDVYAAPVANFNADVKAGCKNVNVVLNNLTANDANAPASSLSYDWDFGDGSPHGTGFKPAPHTYIAKNSPFTVTLTVTNQATGCSNTMVRKDFINITAPPGAQFAVKPGNEISLPNYHFDFADQSNGSPVLWKWTFGDGSTSGSKNPGHTYADTGKYKVTLTVTNKLGCDSTTSQMVQITGIPGQLYVPNAFEPASGTQELKTFIIKGSGIKTWQMQIFNNWGQLLWATTSLDSNGSPTESWDGTYKGIQAPQGVYIWQISAKFINGTDWKGMSYNSSLPKRIGVIHLIR